MKKILLILFAVLSLNTFAEAPKRLFENVYTKTLQPVKFKTQKSFKDFVGSKVEPSAVKAPAKAPTGGTPEPFYMDCFKSVKGFRYLCYDNHVYSEITQTSDGKAYFSNFFYTSILGNDLYIEGTVDADGSIEIGYQKLTDYNGISLYICCVNPSTGYAETNNTFKLIYDSTSKMYYSDTNSYLGIYVDDGDSLQLDTYCVNFTYYPESSFSEPTEHAYSFTDKDGTTKNTVVNMINLGGGYFCVNNMMPGYENVWLLGIFNGNDMTLYSYQVANDDCAFMFLDGNGTMLQDATLGYNNSNNSYDLDANTILGDVIYDDGSTTGNEPGLYLHSNKLTNLSISSIPSTGISKIENDSKDAVSTEYYDLSGRRISNVSKGVNIMVKKFADGTTRAVKVLK